MGKGWRRVGLFEFRVEEVLRERRSSRGEKEDPLFRKGVRREGIDRDR